MNQASSPAIPDSPWAYVKSLGPGIVTVLTWLSMGDLVGSATAGGNYGYALMWAFVGCLLVRALFVSMVTRYQLCNDRGESILSAMGRLHPWLAPLLFVCSLAQAHGVGVFMLVGAGDCMTKLTGVGSIRGWGVFLALLTFLVVFRSAYLFLEKIFWMLAGMLTATFVTLAVLAEPSPSGIASGIFGFAIPVAKGSWDPLLVATALAGALSGGIGNLQYAYFAQAKGWTTPAHRRVQQYDLFFGILVLIVLDLSVWILGAETIYKEGGAVTDLSSLAQLLSATLGPAGATMFYAGILAAIFSSMLGNGKAYGYVAIDAYIQRDPAEAARYRGAYMKHPSYRWVIAWIVLSPVFWVLIGNPDFIGLTLIINAAQTLLIPLIVAVVWIVTTRVDYIGVRYRNGLGGHALFAFLFVVGCFSAFFSAQAIWGQLSGVG